MDYTASGSHPLHISWFYNTFIADAVTVFDLPVEHIGYCLNTSVWMPGKPSDIVTWFIRVEVVQEQEGIQQRHFIISKSALKMNTCTLDCRFALKDF